MLYRLAEKHEIWLDYADLQKHQPGLLGLYVMDEQDGPIILLDSRLEDRPRLHVCVLAEEIAHHLEGVRTSLNTVYTVWLRRPYHNDVIKMWQDEERALRRACNLVLPDWEWWEGIRQGVRTYHEMAEFAQVTEWFARKKHYFMQLEGPIRERRGA